MITQTDPGLLRRLEEWRDKMVKAKRENKVSRASA